MRQDRRSLSFLLLTLALVLGVCGAPADAQDASPAGELSETIGVEVVNIDVVVVDKKGRPVTGLGREDFELRIDGVPVEIANFYAADGGAQDASVQDVATIEEGDLGGGFAAGPPPRRLVAYLDSFYLTPPTRKRVLDDLPVLFEEEIADGHEIMMISHHRGETQFITPFTTDLDKLHEALGRALDLPSSGIDGRRAHSGARQNMVEYFRSCTEANPNVIDIDPCDFCFYDMLQQARIYGYNSTNERRLAVAALDQVVNALAVLPGKKTLLYVSDGVEQYGGLDLFYYLEEICPERRNDIQQEYLRRDLGDLNDLVAHANASRVTFYALEAAGLRGYSSNDVRIEGPIPEKNGAAITNLQPSTFVDQIRSTNLQGTLHYISEETGGKAILNANDFEDELAELADELDTFYSLGYQPEHPGYAQTHRVSVKVEGKRQYDVRYRRTFLHKKDEQVLADRALGAVLFDVTENPLNASVEVRPQQPGSEGRTLVPLEVILPWNKLVLLPGEGGRQGHLTLVVAAPARSKKGSGIRKKDVPITVPEGETPEGLYRVGIEIELEPGSYRLGLGLWDELAAEGSFLTVPVEVEAAPRETAEATPRNPARP